jgi:hypothetical protein
MVAKLKTIKAELQRQMRKRFYRRKLIQKGIGKARIAAAHKLGIRLWIMLRDHIDYQEFCRRGQERQRGDAHAKCTVPILGSGKPPIAVDYSENYPDKESERCHSDRLPVRPSSARCETYPT